MSLLLPRKNFDLEVALGQLKPYRVVDKFGHNPSVAAGSFEDVWDGGGDYEYYPNSPYALEILSGNTSDVLSTGGGAHRVRVLGLNGNFGFMNETVNLAGTTPVTLTNCYSRIFRMYVTQAGSTQGNVGLITLRCKDGPLSGKATAYIGSANGQTLMTTFTTPSGYWGFFQDWGYSVGKGEEGGFFIRTRSIPNGGFRTRRKLEVYQNAYTERLDFKVSVQPKTDIKVLAENTAGVAVHMGANYRIILVDETLVDSSYLSEL